MARYFLEVSYKGTRYSGFQKQDNANTIQAEIEKAFFILHKNAVELTGSSRTDAGVHALQNYFHFDYEETVHPQILYKINAILPDDIVVLSINRVNDNAHCRFDARSRIYRYHLYQQKNPFLQDNAYYFPYKLDLGKLNEAASMLKQFHDFSSFSKRNTQVKTYLCSIEESSWQWEEHLLVFRVKANRFLRGMVRGLTGTMLKVGRGKTSIDEFKDIIESSNNARADFAVPARGLFLTEVEFPENIFK